MSWGTYGIVIGIIFAVFIVLMIISPNLSCFGRRIKSPLYPFFRKKKRKIKTHDYGFKLVDQPSPRKEKKADFKKIKETQSTKDDKKVDDYGFRLD